jgi:50S ribosomal subunit-associated GTPase HflX
MPPVWPDARLSSVLLVVNKIDLPAAWDRAAATEAIAVSALTGAGITELANAIAQRLVPNPPLHSAAVPFTPELSDCIGKALALCRTGRAEETVHILNELV